jgi:hypothetical protein
LTGRLTMLFDVGLRAPHGDTFVMGLVDGGYRFTGVNIEEEQNAGVLKIE